MFAPQHEPRDAFSRSPSVARPPAGHPQVGPEETPPENLKRRFLPTASTDSSLRPSTARRPASHARADSGTRRRCAGRPAPGDDAPRGARVALRHVSTERDRRDCQPSCCDGRRARSAAAGACAAVVWAAAEPVDRRLLHNDYSDVALLGKLVTQSRAWPLVGLAMHAANGAAFGLAYHELRRRRDVSAIRLALTEHVALFPLGVLSTATTRPAVKPGSRMSSARARSRRRPGGISCSEPCSAGSPTSDPARRARAACRRAFDARACGRRRERRRPRLRRGRLPGAGGARSASERARN